MAPKNPEEAKNDTHKSEIGSKSYPKKWQSPVHQHMEVNPPPPPPGDLSSPSGENFSFAKQLSRLDHRTECYQFVVQNSNYTVISMVDCYNRAIRKPLFVQ